MDWSFLIKNKDSLNVTTDSRKITPGCIFVALKGEHFDGNDFVEQAKRDGAAYIIKGENALAELQDLARAWRRKWGNTIIAITGTNGKTTTKELTAAVLKTKYNLHYTQGNLNNSLGVPLTLLQITGQHELAIVEMGASHPGDIKELVDIAEPNCGLITNVGRAHLQGFGSFEGVMATKGELYDYLRAHGGFCFRNTDNPYLKQMAGDLKTVAYTTGTMPEGTHLVGDYNSENVQAAMCVGEYFGVDREMALKAIRDYVPTNNRSQAMKTENNELVVDAYNANPTSMQAAINAFNGNTYILGAMRELGDYSHTEHQNIANMLLERKTDKVLLVGDEWKQTTAPYPIFTDTQALAEYIQANPITNAKILIKGSRSNQLEKIIPLL
ncbi:MAG: UDP-N-acetylmuramoyl-tripeptide--D-alanyl-D-alanine ligase [Paludibacteraceae bacterium]|nr:UDP-N-acetylmuramoyl-tripeptide--D-alanyl-D-alanine ligase [Paludibacteraceae bacterium]MBQ4391381.1 UDP-N-acetylmuramoyl-tripeptide--D-alanyl-D-alanine ligase [Paludibacteraceae bacterium]